MKRLVYIGIALNIAAAVVILLLVVCESPPSDSGSSTSTKRAPVATRSLLQGIHDKLASGQPYPLSRGREISAEVVYFDSDGSLILDSKDEQRGVVFTNKTRPNSKAIARHARLKVVEPTTLKLEMEDFVFETEGSGTTAHTERMNITIQLP